MFAVIESGGKQYRVEPGDVVDVERVEAAVKKDRQIEFDRVLMVGDDKEVEVGKPGVAGAVVSAVLVDDVRGPKVRVFKMKRRKGYRKSRGHRQELMRVRIDAIKTAAKAKRSTKKSAAKKTAAAEDS